MRALLISHEDDDLVEFEHVHEIGELASLLHLFELHVELRETVKGKLVHVDENLLGLRDKISSQCFAKSVQQRSNG